MRVAFAVISRPLSRSPGRLAHGFTLIELLVVVAVLSAVSLLAFNLSAEDRAQLRYDDTRLRLAQLRTAMLGSSTASGGAGGFVADNGDLPADLATLLSRGSLAARGVVQPAFDPVPGNNCASNGGEVVSTPFVSSADLRLIKGHRGDYLGGLAINGRFRDGWGNVASIDDAANFGWVVGNTSGTLGVVSLGADNTPGGSDFFAADLPLTVAPGDYEVPLQGWSVTVANLSGADINRSLSLSLLVFKNDSTGGKWLRHSTPVASVCLDASGGDGLCSGSPASSTHTLSFDAYCKGSDGTTGPSTIPQGRHLILVTYHAGSTLWQGTDSPYWDNGSKIAAARIDAMAGQPLPPMRLELR